MTPDPALRINALLPQTQCTRCGYPACLAYAEAIAAGEADINQCPPGGAQGIRELATLLGRAAKPLNPANGIEKPAEIALIDEDACIGCTKCIQVCPVDAIVGANKLMHTILSAECNGCELCIPACPVDCIAMIVDPAQLEAPHNARAAHYRERYEARNARLAHEREKREAAIAARKAEVHATSRSAVLEAIARAKAKKAAGTTPVAPAGNAGSESPGRAKNP
ncbi:MAG: RnfABCDGE type electron transport complex subunit B [Proteobacteria bacterium]|uniref:RnfABCDGE type electron transport complex subunit B n=1 Tax=Rudaea sp. TaxID=2136325 RepID=UPI0032203F9F|nr:RnfABCDGE type electron transport complex subunit B [Pseudomonadota bacterium]